MFPMHYFSVLFFFSFLLSLFLYLFIYLFIYLLSFSFPPGVGGRLRITCLIVALPGLVMSRFAMIFVLMKDYQTITRRNQHIKLPAYYMSVNGRW